MSAIHLTYEVPGDDFTRAGEASGAVKKRLKALGYNNDAIRRVAIAMYEAEINMVMVSIIELLKCCIYMKVILP
jgi:hypothetical protein